MQKLILKENKGHNHDSSACMKKYKLSTGRKWICLTLVKADHQPLEEGFVG